MTVTEVTDVVSVPGKMVKKFTTNLSAGSGQDTTTWTCPLGITSVTYLVVAGGGSGNARRGGGGGGGGAGGMLEGTLTVIPGQSYTIKVGTGGASVSTPYASTLPNNVVGNNGSNSQFDTIIANGGGRGGSWYNAANGGGGAAGSGGSGGGGAYGSDSPYMAGGAGISGQGYAGGTANSTFPGSGGGAGGVGRIATGGVNSGYGTGGAGKASSITGVSVTYAKGGDTCPLTSYANGTNHLGNGGSCSVTNSGGAAYVSGAGGSGIVVLQYNNPKALIRSGFEWL